MKLEYSTMNYNFSLTLGIDPGKSGGMAVVKNGLNSGGAKICTAFKCPKTIDEMSAFIGMLVQETPYIACYLEKVHAFPTDGRSSVFKFGTNYGIWQGILSANKIATKLVVPRVWQKHYGLLPKDKQERKRKLRDIATEKSGIKATLLTADAICIALYGHDTEESWKMWIPKKCT